MLRVLLVASAIVMAATGDKFNAADRPATGAPGGAIVHLFEWKFADIANECEKFLGPNGYAGVQVSPITEHAVLRQAKGWDKYIKKIPFNELVTNTKWYEDFSTYRPWAERYQPVSYKIYSRSGDEKLFRDMVSRCNKAGVKVYVDVVLNHMTRKYPKDAAIGVGGSRVYTGKFEYPAVPYDKNDFNKPTCEIRDYNNLKQLRQCEHTGLHDLNQTDPCVREKMRTFLNELISMGVAGFRVATAQYMEPADLEKIFNRTDYLHSIHGFRPEAVPFVYHDLTDDKISAAVKVQEYYTSGSVMDYTYATEVSAAFSGTKTLKDLEKLPQKYDASKSSQSVVFLDTHQTQRGFIVKDILTYTKPKQYRMATAFILAYPYGEPQIMSSYKFGEPMTGPPTDKEGKIATVTFAADGCTKGWICEHRWKQIHNMVKFRNAVIGEKLSNWTVHGPNQISFGRGNKGFIVFNADGTSNFKKTIHTGLPQGVYCDIIAGGLQGGGCSHKAITVDNSGNAEFSLLTTDSDGVTAIYEGSKIKK